MVGVTIDSEYCRCLVVQQDGTIPHTGRGTGKGFNWVGKKIWDIQLVNINDQGFFASLKSRVWKESLEQSTVLLREPRGSRRVRLGNS